MLLALDPGIRGCGVSLFDSTKTLAEAHYVENTARTGNKAAECVSMAEAVRSFAARWSVTTVVVEWPQVYVKRLRTNPNDLLALAGVDSALCALFPRCKHVTYLPMEWKQQIDKEAHHRRAMARLSEAECGCIKLPAKDLQHNVFDAIALGLKHLGRLEPKRVYPR